MIAPRREHPWWLLTGLRIKYRRQIFTNFKNIFYNSRRGGSDPWTLEEIRRTFILIFEPDEAE
jgi:hypothetical protein